MPEVRERLAGCATVLIAILGMTVGLSLLTALPTLYLWNWLMPVLFGLPVITFWQALGITFLANILFKPIGDITRQ